MGPKVMAEVMLNYYKIILHCYTPITKKKGSKLISYHWDPEIP